MRRIARITGAVFLIGFASQALAFEVEQPSGGPARDGAQPKAEVVSPGQALKKKPESGTEVRIPGLGRIGVLPKLDFGLELLYGANKDGPVAQQAPEEKSDPSDDSFRIRGSIKHRF